MYVWIHLTVTFCLRGYVAVQVWLRFYVRLNVVQVDGPVCSTLTKAVDDQTFPFGWLTSYAHLEVFFL